jgi:serine/threonine protein kinase/tetratricopeptide (TPR) repeat protein
MHARDPTPSLDLGDLSAEPSAIRQLTAEQKECLTDILDRYLSALEAGVPPKPEELLREHPELAGPLQLYLSSLNDLHAVAAGFGNVPERAEPESVAAASDEKRLGDFILGREIGRGGMGVVYEAHQISLGRRVALKILPFAAVLDSKQIARFKNEAKAAAQLHHPNIVPVYAVGAERGVHYYAMQLIEGQPLDRAIAELRRQRRVGAHHADRSVVTPTRSASEGASRIPDFPSLARRVSVADEDEAANDDSSAEHVTNEHAASEPVALSTAHSFLTQKSTNRREYFDTILRMGIQAAEALHAAHELGIVHRDIKPSNLLLDHDGTLWVTDFGLARFQSDLGLSRSGDVVGTLRYMSPEQARGQTAMVDHRTDVYSLGVTLYELLALQPAFTEQDRQALLRRIDQHEPRRLSQLCPDIPADLETVVLKALAKQRDERYSTAQQFADDLRRVLEGKPTLAKPPTIVDRLGKWARRHRRLVAAAVAVCLLFMLGSAISTVLITREKFRAEQNFSRAERNFRDARDAVDRFGSQLADRLADVPGADRVRRELLQETLQYYREFVEQAGDDPSLRAELALTYSKIGALTEELGSTEEAIAAHENASRLFQQLADEQPRVADYRRQLAVSWNNLALALSHTGRSDESRRAYGDAIQLQQQLVANAPDDAQFLRDLALSHANLGLLQSDTGAADEAERSLREAIRLQEQAVALRPDDPDSLRDLGASYNNLSALYVNTQPDRAADFYAQALAYQTQAAAKRPGDLKCQSDVALTYNNLGAVQSRLEQIPEAAQSYRRAIEIQQQLVRAAPSLKTFRRDLAASHNNLGLAQSKLGEPAGAEQSFKLALELQDLLALQDPDDVGLQSGLGGIYNNLGIVLEEVGRENEAASSYRQAIEHQKIAFLKAPDVARYRAFLSKHDYNYGRVLRRLGRSDEAAQVAWERKQLWPGDPQRLFSVAEELALAYSGLRAAGVEDGRLSAEECASRAIDVLREAVAAGFKVPADLESNEAFAALKDDPRFAKLIGR